MYSLSFDLASPLTCSTAVNNSSTLLGSSVVTAHVDKTHSNTSTSIPQITRVLLNAPSAPLTSHTEHADLFFNDLNPDIDMQYWRIPNVVTNYYSVQTTHSKAISKECYPILVLL